MSIAIVALVRGYKDKNKYKDLFLRNESIFKHISSKVSEKIDFILFHEGNISFSHQKYIQENSKDKLTFIDVSQDFNFDHELLNQVKDIERFNSGYRLMCRFNFYGIWKYLENYDYVMRVDEDVIIEKFDIKNINFIKENEIIFSTISLSGESHEPTNETLPEALKEVFNSNSTNFYNHKFPYTNLYISRTDFWLESNISSNLKKLASDRQFINRWGDLPILGSFLNFYNKEIYLLKNSTYFHSSHNTQVSNRKFLKFLN